MFAPTLSIAPKKNSMFAPTLSIAPKKIQVYLSRMRMFAVSGILLLKV
jgi:hypothetical protein